MDYQVNDKDLKGLKIGFWWNAIIVLLNIFNKPFSVWNNGATQAQTLSVLLTLVLICLPVLALSYILLRRMQTAPSRNMALFGIVISIAGMLFLNVIGSILSAVYYVKVISSNLTKS